eukprot:1758882-Prymnesium_polylepis.1
MRRCALPRTAASPLRGGARRCGLMCRGGLSSHRRAAFRSQRRAAAAASSASRACRFHSSILVSAVGATSAAAPVRSGMQAPVNRLPVPKAAVGVAADVRAAAAAAASSASRAACSAASMSLACGAYGRRCTALTPHLHRASPAAGVERASLATADV